MFIRTENGILDLEKDIELLKSQAIHNINEKCNYMYDDFYNEEDLTPKQIEEKRKDNINSLKVETGTNENGFYIFIDNKDMVECCVEKNYGKVVKQADTIEELCDEYVCCKDIIFESELDDYIATGNTVYGAIWTDKGLIYVAKMNEKGELELL